MQPVFEELDYQSTPLGDISLRRRSEPMSNDTIVYEIRLDDEFLMSSLFTEAERQLATLALAALDEEHTDVIVGGLGLGYTAAAVLDVPSVASLTVIELLEPVIDWHRRGLVPNSKRLVSDPRCTLVLDDFFELAMQPGTGFERSGAGPAVHAVLLDIDHSPEHRLDDRSRAFYSPRGMQTLATKLHAGGIFGLWSNDPPDDAFRHLLCTAFGSVESHEIRFANPYTGGESASTVYLATRSRGGD